MEAWLKPSVVANVAAGSTLLLVAAALAIFGRSRAARLLGLSLASTGTFWILLPVMSNGPPDLAQAAVVTGAVGRAIAPPSLLLFALEFTGVGRALSRKPAFVAALFALPAFLVAVEVLGVEDPAPVPSARANGLAWYWLWSLSPTFGTLAGATTVTLLAVTLARERDPSLVPARALLLAGFVPPTALLGVELVLMRARWSFLSAWGLPVPPLLPRVTPLVILLTIALAFAPALAARRATGTAQRDALLGAAALAAVIVLVLGLADEGESNTSGLRWVFFGLLLAYGALRHGLFGERRALPGFVELPLAAAGFCVTTALCVSTLAELLPAWAAVTGGLGLALVASALVLAISGERGRGPGEARYEEVRELGRGGAGRAVLALDRRLHRSVVLKRLPSGGDALREARAAARVAHPNLVAVHDVVEDAGGAALVLEYVPGGTLEERLAAGPLAPDDARRIGIEIADGLAALHRAGLVHGDVKASNVLLRGDGRAALGDFGAARRAKSVEETLAALPRASAAGSLAGVAPEVLLGDEPDGRADAYGLGALLYRLLTGEHYVKLPPTLAEARDVVLREPPRLPHARVPAPWEPVLACALAKDPSKRFAGLPEMRDALARLE